MAELDAVLPLQEDGEDAEEDGQAVVQRSFGMTHRQSRDGEISCLIGRPTNAMGRLVLKEFSLPQSFVVTVMEPAMSLSDAGALVRTWIDRMQWLAENRYLIEPPAPFNPKIWDQYFEDSVEFRLKREIREEGSLFTKRAAKLLALEPKKPVVLADSPVQYP